MFAMTRCALHARESQCGTVLHFASEDHSKKHAKHMAIGLETLKYCRAALLTTIYIQFIPIHNAVAATILKHCVRHSQDISCVSSHLIFPGTLGSAFLPSLGGNALIQR